METISQYMKAVVDLHACQASRNLVSEPSVRGKALKAQYGERQRYRNSYQDRALHTFKIVPRLRSSSRFRCFFAEGKERSFRDRMVFLMQHMTLLRCENTRDMDLADLFPLQFKDEGFSECPVLVVRMDHGKTTKFGTVQYAGTIRHRDHRVCVFGALAMYFFYRWHITNEGFPRFDTNKDWFDLKVAKGIYRDRAMTYGVQLNAINRAFKACHISSSKKTHAGRGSGARHAEFYGTTEDQLPRHDQWNMQIIEACYLASLPRTSMRIINGFPGEKGQFWIPRANVSPPESLQRKVFPKVDELLSPVQAGEVQAGEVCQNSISAQAFCQLLKNMREIFLQDVVMFRVDNGSHPFFNHKLFRDPEFLAFERAMLATCQIAQEPADMQLQRAMPIVSQQLQIIGAKMDSNLAILERLLLERKSHQVMDNNRFVTINDLSQAVKLLRQACSVFASGH